MAMNAGYATSTVRPCINRSTLPSLKLLLPTGSHNRAHLQAGCDDLRMRSARMLQPFELLHPLLQGVVLLLQLQVGQRHADLHW